MMDFEKADQLVARGLIEVAPIAFMRGRTLNDAFVILDEAQNTTSEQMKMFLTRLGFESKAVVTGDVTQIDLPDSRALGPDRGRRACSRTSRASPSATSPRWTSCATRWCRRSSAPTTPPRPPRPAAAGASRDPSVPRLALATAGEVGCARVPGGLRYARPPGTATSSGNDGRAVPLRAGRAARHLAGAVVASATSASCSALILEKSRQITGADAGSVYVVEPARTGRRRAARSGCTSCCRRTTR